MRGIYKELTRPPLNIFINLPSLHNLSQHEAKQLPERQMNLAYPILFGNVRSALGNCLRKGFLELHFCTRNNELPGNLRQKTYHNLSLTACICLRFVIDGEADYCQDYCQTPSRL